MDIKNSVSSKFTGLIQKVKNFESTNDRELSNKESLDTDKKTSRLAKKILSIKSSVKNYYSVQRGKIPTSSMNTALSPVINHIRQRVGDVIGRSKTKNSESLDKAKKTLGIGDSDIESSNPQEKKLADLGQILPKYTQILNVIKDKSIDFAVNEFEKFEIQNCNGKEVGSLEEFVENFEELVDQISGGTKENPSLYSDKKAEMFDDWSANEKETKMQLQQLGEALSLLDEDMTYEDIFGSTDHMAEEGINEKQDSITEKSGGFIDKAKSRLRSMKSSVGFSRSTSIDEVSAQTADGQKTEEEVKEKQVSGNKKSTSFIDKAKNQLSSMKSSVSLSRSSSIDEISTQTAEPVAMGTHETFDITEAIGKVGDYELGDLPPLSDSAQALLHKGCDDTPSTEKREAFIENLHARMSNIASVAPQNGKKPVTSFLDFLGGDKELLDLYKSALKEEGQSKEFRNAVFTQSTEVYNENPCSGKKCVMYIGGPSGAGKSFSREAFVNELSKRTASEQSTEQSDGEESYVVSVDGGEERKVSQIRQMVLQAALVKGYGGIADLEKQSKMKAKTKTLILKAALEEGNHMHVVIPATFVGRIGTFRKLMGKLNKNKEVLQVFAEVRADQTGNLSQSEALSSFRETIQYNGESRAFLSEKKSFSLDKMKMNNREIPCESKKYTDHFKAGVRSSKAAKLMFKRLVSSKRSLFLSNESDNIHIKKSTNGKWVQTTNSPELTHVSRRELNLWNYIHNNQVFTHAQIGKHLNEFGLDKDKAGELTEEIFNDIDNFQDLEGLLSFLKDNDARAKLMIS